MADARKCKGCLHHTVNDFGYWCMKERAWCSDRNKSGLCKYYEPIKKQDKI